jgi:hypothetical protein
LTEALADAQRAVQDSSQAMADGDWAAYGEAQDRLTAALEEALSAEAEIAAAAGTESASESASDAPAPGESASDAGE